MVSPLLLPLSLFVCPSLPFLWMTALLTMWIQSTRNLCPCSEGPFHGEITWPHCTQVDPSLPAGMWAMAAGSYTLLKCWHRVTLLTMTSCWSVTVGPPGLRSHSHWCHRVGQKVRQKQKQGAATESGISRPPTLTGKLHHREHWEQLLKAI